MRVQFKLQKTWNLKTPKSSVLNHHILPPRCCLWHQDLLLFPHTSFFSFFLFFFLSQGQQQQWKKRILTLLIFTGCSTAMACQQGSSLGVSSLSIWTRRVAWRCTWIGRVWLSTRRGCSLTVWWGLTLASDTAQGVGRDVKGRAFLVATCERYHSHRSFVGLSLSRFEDPPICRSHSGTLSCPFSLFLL